MHGRGFSQDTTVYYSVEGFTEAERERIDQAARDWTNVNHHNNSRVAFRPADATHPPTLKFKAGPATHRGHAYAGMIERRRDRILGNIATADITINKNNEGGDFFDRSNTSRYLDAILKVALHELGHAMGLRDQEAVDHPDIHCGGQGQGLSVMNGYCGVNDIGGTLPTFVTECDASAINTVPGYMFPPPPPVSGPPPPPPPPPPPGSCTTVVTRLWYRYLQMPGVRSCRNFEVWWCHETVEVFQQICEPSGAIVGQFTQPAGTVCTRPSGGGSCFPPILPLGPSGPTKVKP